MSAPYEASTVTFSYRVTVYVGGEPTDQTLTDLSARFGGATLLDTRGLWLDESGHLIDEGGTAIVVLVATRADAHMALAILQADATRRGEDAVAYTVDETRGGVV